MQPPLFRILLGLGVAHSALGDVGATDRVRLAQSVRPLVSTPTLPATRIVRSALTSAEAGQTLAVVVSLRLRNFDELQRALQSGRTVPLTEMEERFLPLRGDYDAVTAWLEQQGLTITLSDARHTHLFARGSISALSAAFHVSFVRIDTGEGELSSSFEAPAVPAEWADAILSVEGLQPQLALHPQSEPGAPVSAAALTNHPTRAIPADVRAAYHTPATLDGHGQTIAIVAGAVPLASDLDAFYTSVGVDRTATDLVVVPVNGGPTPASQSAGLSEVTMDVEWSSGIAPGATVMLYATPTYSLGDLMAACVQIMNEGKARAVSHSASAIETSLAPATLQANSQLFAQMAAAGITVLHGDGDNGAGGAPMYPASDPYVTGLSGTTLTFDAQWNAVSETAWPQAGGGVSTVFTRPAWQKGVGVPAGTMRCVPDAGSVSSAVAATGQLFPHVIRNGQTVGVGGSSLTGPVWSGLVALINQARGTAGLPPVGFLAPRLYPLIGTGALQDITSGSNGYDAAPGYDLCTGVGTPNVAGLITALTTSDPPTIARQPTAQTVTTGATVVFTTSVTGLPAPTLQWSRDGIALPAATTDTLVLTDASVVAGNYTCVATNASGSAQTAAARLSVVATNDPGRLANLSILTELSNAVPSFTVGTYVGGGSGGVKPLLIRAAGPTLKAFGVAAPLADPKLDVVRDGSVIASNDNWSGNPALTTVFDQTGAFRFGDAASKDAAVYLPSASAGGYSIQIGGVASATGTALVELYDAMPSAEVTPEALRLMNISVLKTIPGRDMLTAGFVVVGSSAKTVLVRAIGPALGRSPFNIPGVMADPQVTLFDHAGTKIVGNDNWGGAAALNEVSARVSAFTLGDIASKDAVILVTLPPGSYSAQVSDVSGSGGLVIVEVYDVP